MKYKLYELVHQIRLDNVQHLDIRLRHSAEYMLSLLESTSACLNYSFFTRQFKLGASVPTEKWEIKYAFVSSAEVNKIHKLNEEACHGK